GSRWMAGPRGVPLTVDPAPVLTIAKLHHDLQQMKRLSAGGQFADADEVIARYESVLTRSGGRAGGWGPGNNERNILNDTYGRLLYLHESPRVERALSPGWNPGSIQERYLSHPLGLAVIDDFLTSEALESMRRFCMDSTIWFTNRYDHGRLGSFF